MSATTIRERVIAVALAVVEEEFRAVCREDNVRVTETSAEKARANIRRSLDGLGDCRAYERSTDAEIRASFERHPRPLVREALALRRPS